MKVRWLRWSLWLFGFGCLWLPVFDDPPLRTGAYVQDVTAHTAAVRIVTAADRELQCEFDDGATRIAQEAATGRRHEFTCTGLQAGHAYTFVIRDGQREVDRGSFHTAPDDDRAPVRFALLGDSGALPWWSWLQTSPAFYLPAHWQWLGPHPRIARMGSLVLDDHPEFFLHLGDICYPWGWQGHYATAFFAPFAPLLRSAACYVTLGNHDVLDDNGRQALSNFRLPADGSGDGRMYSFGWGSVRVVVLDCNDAVTAAGPVMTYARAALQAGAEPWQIVVSHFPIRSASRQGDRADLIDNLLPLLRTAAVDLYVCGHDHTYQRFGRDGDVPQIVSGGGGKSLYEIYPHPEAEVVVAQYNHCLVTVQGREFELRARGLDGALIDTLRQRLDADKVARLRAFNPGRAARIEALLR